MAEDNCLKAHKGVQVSLVVPILNEEEQIEVFLSSLEQQTGLQMEVIFADGGSDDQTVCLLNRYSPRQLTTTVIQSRSGRGRQMNKGFTASNGEYVLFLHVDCRFSSVNQLSDAIKAIKEAELVRGRRDVAGFFPIGFERGSHNQDSRYRYWEYRNKLDLRPYIVFGDQGALNVS